jgi:SWI/SNF-related matrix-associated actin-dependent regulator of chromatin subfamily A3
LIPQARLKRAEAVCKEIERRNLHKERPMTAAEGRALLEKLQGVFEENTDGTAECAVCLEDFPKENATILRTCMHSYCEACITNVLSMNPRRCPLCRADFEQKDVVKMTDASNAAKKGLADEDTTRMKASSDGSEFSEENLLNSPKIQELLQQLQRMGGDEKAVIFSQFTQFLNVITRAVDKAGFRFTRIDGTMSAPQRIKAMNDFNSNSKDSPRLILCSLMAAGTGINLTRGNWCFMMDSWWNKAVEDQAMDRIHRIGQSRPVTVVKLIIQDTIEERIIKLQESKAMILKGTLEKLSGDEMRQARLAALMGLFGIEDP